MDHQTTTAILHDDAAAAAGTVDPQTVLEDAVRRFAEHKIAVSFSGAEDVVLIDMLHRLGLQCDVFSLDTGRLHPETYRYFETVRERYDVAVEMIMPEPTAVAELVREKGLFSFYTDGHNECCSVRKIQPLRGKLATLDAWITGQRRDQSVTRSDVPFEQVDSAFSTTDHQLVKFNPLSAWSSGQVWDYIRSNDVPYNPLHERGFISIGCEPCTRPVTPGQHERAGRWWWEEATQKECGLHGQNVVKIVG